MIGIYPAYAGVVLRWSGTELAPVLSPRVRGDGPIKHLRRINDALVLPAYAGMFFCHSPSPSRAWETVTNPSRVSGPQFSSSVQASG